MTWSDRFYFGTWQLSGDFRPLSNIQKEILVKDAWSKGVRKFDTAAVYGGGSVEKILGEVLPQSAHILTKIPAQVRPRDRDIVEIQMAYPAGQVRSSFRSSQERLGETRVSTVLLHNWHASWVLQWRSVVYELCQLREEGLVRAVGISLPDGFEGILSSELLDVIDVIEVPYNSSNKWITSVLPEINRYGVEVILRSIFLHGLSIRSWQEVEQLSENDPRRNRVNGLTGMYEMKPYELFRDAWSLGTSLTLGMTTLEQLAENLQFLKGAPDDLQRL